MTETAQVLKMTGRDNADGKWCENIIEEEDSLRTVNCLRGRLLAERLASRNATKEAEHLGNKLLELENLLNEEAKSRNRAEKKLKFLMKRLESMNIVQEFEENVESPKGSANLQENDSQLSLWSLFHGSVTTEGSSTSSNENPVSSTVEDCLSSAGEPHSEKPSHLNLNQMCIDSTMNEQRMESSSEEGLNQEDDQDPENHVDNSMALVAVEMPKENERIDTQVVDASVKEVLESLRRAKEQLQSSMERRRMNMSMSMIKVG